MILTLGSKRGNNLASCLLCRNVLFCGCVYLSFVSLFMCPKACMRAMYSARMRCVYRTGDNCGLGVLYTPAN